MAINFLQALRGAPMQAPSMPTPVQAPTPPPMPQFQGNLQAMTQGAPANSRLANIMQAIGGSSPAPAAQMQQQPVGEAPRKRRSFLETVGQIADVVARVGGAEALYQPTLDAREDRTREIDLDELRKRVLEQQVSQGDQTIEAGKAELEDTERARLAQALGAVASNPDAIAMWPQLAAQAGIDEQRAAQIGGILQQNPGSAEIFARSLGWSPSTSKSGSQAKELQVYGLLLDKGGPELANAYLKNLTDPEGMTEYQRATLALSLRQLGMKEEDTEFDRSIKLEELDLKRDKAEGIDLTPTQRGQVTQKLKLIPVAKQQYQRVRTLYNEMLEDGTLARGPLGGLVPGQLAGGKAEEFDKAVGALRKSILTMTRIPGIGSMSNYETMLDEAALPSRWGSDEGRAEAINGIGQLLEGYESGYRDMLGTASAARPAANRPAPRGRSNTSSAPAPRRSMSPAAIEARRRGLID